MYCKICKKSEDEDINPCINCIDILCKRLQLIKFKLDYEFMNKITELCIFFCEKEYRNKKNLCEICNGNYKNLFSEIQYSCFSCNTQIINRSTLFLNDLSIEECIETGYRCYIQNHN